MIEKSDLPELWKLYQQIVKSRTNPPLDKNTDDKWRIVWMLTKISRKLDRSTFDQIVGQIAPEMPSKGDPTNKGFKWESETLKQWMPMFAEKSWAPNRDDENQPVDPDFLDVEPPPVQPAPPDAPEVPGVDLGGLSEAETQGQSMSFLDKMQLALDAIGIVEPTPFADAANAGVSMMRAVFNPSEAGQHMTNAAISLAGMFPYIGDIAKVGKTYGKFQLPKTFKGASNRRTGSQNGLGGLVLQSLAGSLGGGSGSPHGGGGGGGNQPGPGGGGSGGGGSGGNANPPSGGGAPPAQPPGGLGGGGGGTGSSSGGIGDAFQNLVGAVTFAVTAIRAFSGWVEKVVENGRGFIESQRGLAMFSGSASAAMANYDYAAIARQVQNAEKLGPSLTGAINAQVGAEDALNEYMLPMQELSNHVQRFGATAAESLLGILKYVEPIHVISKNINLIIDYYFGPEAPAQHKNPIDAAVNADAMKIPKQPNKLPARDKDAKVI